MTEAAAVRASAVRDTLDFLDVFQPGLRAAVLERVPAPSRDVLETTPRSGWIEVVHDHYTVDAMVSLLGRKRAIQCWSDALATLVERPLLRAFVAGMTGLVGNDPIRVLGILAKGWSLVYRDCCEPTVTTDAEGRAVVRFAKIAPEVRRYRHYLDSWEGACRGFARITRLEGEVLFRVAEDLSSAEATFGMR